MKATAAARPDRRPTCLPFNLIFSEGLSRFTVNDARI